MIPVRSSRPVLSSRSKSMSNASWRPTHMVSMAILQWLRRQAKWLGVSSFPPCIKHHHHPVSGDKGYNVDVPSCAERGLEWRSMGGGCHHWDWLLRGGGGPHRREVVDRRAEQGVDQGESPLHDAHQLGER